MNAQIGSNPFAGSSLERDYEILDVVGRGKRSIVYRARVLPHSRIPERLWNKIVAVKVLTGYSRNPEINEQRITREALAMLSCRHPYIIKIHNYEVTEELCYLSMEYADQGDLSGLLARQAEPLDVHAASEILRQILLGLDTIHATGVIHRDIKPENILLNHEGQVRIGDFGVAILPPERKARYSNKEGVGTFDYLAPETLEQGVVDEQTDLYAVAVTFFQMLTNHAPFIGDSMKEQLDKKVAGIRIPLEAFFCGQTRHLEKFLDRAMNPDRELRFKSAAEFYQGLEQCLESIENQGQRSMGSSFAESFKRVVGRSKSLLAKKDSIGLVEEKILAPAGALSRIWSS